MADLVVLRDAGPGGLVSVVGGPVTVPNSGGDTGITFTVPGYLGDVWLQDWNLVVTGIATLGVLTGSAVRLSIFDGSGTQTISSVGGGSQTLFEKYQSLRVTAHGVLVIAELVRVTDILNLEFISPDANVAATGVLRLFLRLRRARPMGPGFVGPPVRG